YERVLAQQGVAVHVERLLSDFVEDEDDRRVAAAEALYKLEPVFGVGVLAALAPAQDEQVEAALGQKKLVRGVHYLLPAEIPDVEAHAVSLLADRERPL